MWFENHDDLGFFTGCEAEIIKTKMWESEELSDYVNDFLKLCIILDFKSFFFRFYKSLIVCVLLQVSIFLELFLGYLSSKTFSYFFRMVPFKTTISAIFKWTIAIAVRKFKRKSKILMRNWGNRASGLYIDISESLSWCL